jgi:cell division protein FtsB
MRTAHAKAQIRKRRETDFWRAVNRFMVLLIGIGAVVVIVLAFVPELRRIQEMRANLDGLQHDLAGQQLLLRQQQRQEKWLQNDPAYVEILARDRLGVMKEGETIFRFDEPTIETPSAPVSTKNP